MPDDDEPGMHQACADCGEWVVDLWDLVRVTQERDEARAELARHKAWWDAAEPVLKRANEQRESWSQIARAQARELTKAKARVDRLDDECQGWADLLPKYDGLRKAAQRVIDTRESTYVPVDSPVFHYADQWAALDALSAALTDEPTEADHV